MLFVLVEGKRFFEIDQAPVLVKCILAYLLCPLRSLTQLNLLVVAVVAVVSRPFRPRPCLLHHHGVNALPNEQQKEKEIGHPDMAGRRRRRPLYIRILTEIFAQHVRPEEEERGEVNEICRKKKRRICFRVSGIQREVSLSLQFRSRGAISLASQATDRPFFPPSFSARISYL